MIIQTFVGLMSDQEKNRGDPKSVTKVSLSSMILEKTLQIYGRWLLYQILPKMCLIKSLLIRLENI